MLDYGAGFLGRVGFAPGFSARRLGVADAAMRAALDRIKADADALGVIYGRNAAIPLQFPHVNQEYKDAATIVDGLWKNYYLPYQQNPDDPRFSQLSLSALDSLNSSLDDLEGRLADMGQKLAKYEAQAKGGGPTGAPGKPSGLDVGQAVGIAVGTAVVLLAVGEITGVTNILGMKG